jgi:hypothetical protein
MENDLGSMTVAPVRYYVGDLCYVMKDHDEWTDLLDQVWDPDNEGECGYELDDGREFIFMNTAWGDGVYNDLDGNPYSVDSGSIGAIRADYVDPNKLAKVIEQGLGHIHEFPVVIDGIDCYEENGRLHFYTVCIDTMGASWEDEEEEE